MRYKTLEIPGGTTTYEDNPEVTVVRNELSRPDLRIKYAAALLKRTPSHEIYTYGVLTFFSLLEYRWVASEYAYPHFESAEGDWWGDSPLIEIEDSGWIAAMKANSSILQVIEANPETLIQMKIRHFRFWILEYGVFDILANRFESETLVERVPLPDII